MLQKSENEMSLAYCQGMDAAVQEVTEARKGIPADKRTPVKSPYPKNSQEDEDFWNGYFQQRWRML